MLVSTTLTFECRKSWNVKQLLPYSVEGDSTVNVQVAEKTRHTNKKCMVRTNCLHVLYCSGEPGSLMTLWNSAWSVPSTRNGLRSKQSRQGTYVSLSCRPFGCRLVLGLLLQLTQYVHLSKCDIARYIQLQGNWWPNCRNYWTWAYLIVLDSFLYGLWLLCFVKCCCSFYLRDKVRSRTNDFLSFCDFSNSLSHLATVFHWECIRTSMTYILYFKQLTKAYVAETSCNQLFDWLIPLRVYVFAHQDRFASYHNIAMSLYNITYTLP